MKKTLLLIATLILLSTGMSHALTEKETTTIDQIITRWHARQAQNTLVNRVQSILTRIDDIQTRARMTQRTTEILEHIEMRLQKILIAAQTPGGITSGTVIPPRVQNSSAFPQSITIPTQRENNPLIIGGGGPALLNVIEFAVSTEAMLIDTITLSTSRDELPEYIAEAALYDDAGNLIKTTTITNDVITFDGFSVEKKAGSHKMYVSIIPFRNDSNETPSPLSFSSATYGIQAQGAITRTKIQKTGTIGQSMFTTVTIAPVGISTAQFVSSREGTQSNTLLSNGTNTLGILAITTPSIISRYSKDIIINTLTITINDGTTAKNVASALRLERINNGSSINIAGSVQGNTVTFTLTNEDTLNTIQQGQSAAFRFTADLTLDPAVRESVQLKIENLKQGGITYHAKNNNTPISSVQQWNWQSEGARISD